MQLYNSFNKGELRTWCQNNSILPEGEDDPYVVGYRVHLKDEDIKKVWSDWRFYLNFS